MKRSYAVYTALAVAGLVFAGVALAKPNGHREVGSTLEVHFFDDGKVLVRGARVIEVGSSTINARTSWNGFGLDWTVNTDSSTGFVRRFGGSSSISEISKDDIISFKGSLVSTTATASSPTVDADIVKDWSIQKKNASFFGSVLSVDLGAKTFMLNAEGNRSLKVFVDPETKITKTGKGKATSTFEDIKTGLKVHAKGLWNNIQNTLDAERIRIFVSPLTLRRVFEGKVKVAPTTTPPTSFTADIGNTEVTVNVDANTSVLNRLWERISLTAFQVGHKIRIYGAREENTIEATVVRDTDLP